MKAEWIKIAKDNGAKWIFWIKDLDVEDEFYDLAWDIDGKRELEEEYRWNNQFEIVELKIV